MNSSSSLVLPPFPHAPIDAIAEELASLCAAKTRVLLSAPAGTGKSTRVAFWLLQQPWCQGKVLLIEPRRMAVTSLARYLAGLFQQKVGDLIGIRMRGETRVSSQTRLEIMTPGILTRMLLQNQSLQGVSAVLFDEFHERNLANDLSLALGCEVQEVLRPDLRLLLMSATPEENKALLSFSTLTCQVHAYPVRFLYCPPRAGISYATPPFWEHMAACIVSSFTQNAHGLLAFLPGRREIAFVTEMLSRSLPSDVALLALTSETALGIHKSIATLRAKKMRYVLLATSVAESAVTIEGIDWVVDCGLSRFTRFDPRKGQDVFVTERVSQACATQRAGRAGRLGPGCCVRLYNPEEERGFLATTPSEMSRCDLTDLVQTLAAFGATDYASAQAYTWLDPLPQASFARAQELLVQLGALDASFHLTPLGRKMSTLALTPRLAKLVVYACEQNLAALGCALAAFCELLWQGALTVSNEDFLLEFERLCDVRREHDSRKSATFIKRVGLLARHLSPMPIQTLLDTALQSIASVPLLLVQALPDFLARDCPTKDITKISYQLQNGMRASLPLGSPLSNETFLVLVAVSDTQEQMRIRVACGIEESLVRTLYASSITNQHWFVVNDKHVLTSFVEERLGAISLTTRQEEPKDVALIRSTLVKHLQSLGLRAFALFPKSAKIEAFLARLRYVANIFGAPPWPKVSNEDLLETLDRWLGPLLSKPQALMDLTQESYLQALQSLLSAKERAMLSKEAPEFWTAPSGRTLPIHYEQQTPYVEGKLQEFFGTTATPTLGSKAIPLTIHLLSPAMRPLQITNDLVHFFMTSYAAVRKEMRGRYPKHFWPEDPLAALPSKTSLQKAKKEHPLRQHGKDVKGPLK